MSGGNDSAGHAVGGKGLKGTARSKRRGLLLKSRKNRQFIADGTELTPGYSPLAQPCQLRLLLESKGKRVTFVQKRTGTACYSF